LTGLISNDSSVGIQIDPLPHSAAWMCAAMPYRPSVERRASTSKGTIMSEPTPSGLTDNAAGAIAYITFVPAIVFLVLPPYNTKPYVRFHAWQSIFLNVAAFVISVALSFLMVFFVFFGAFFLLAFSRLIWLLWFVLWLVCVLKALNGQRFKVPIIGDLAEKQAGG
jgi:uncharacterized membrane protein